MSITYDKEDVERLVAAAIVWREKGMLFNNRDGSSELYMAIEPFRKAAAVIGMMITTRGTVRAVELTAAVKARNGPTAGVDSNDVNAIVINGRGDFTNRAGAIMQLIADATPDIEGDL